MRYAARINGLDALALTKLDVLDGLESIEICTWLPHAAAARSPSFLPILPPAPYEAGLRNDAGLERADRGARDFDELPAEARGYVARLEEVSGVPVAIVSTGSDRDETIIRKQSIAEQWLAG